MATALTTHAYNFFALFFLSLCICSEAYIILNKWEPVYQFITLSIILLFLSLRWLLFKPHQIYLVDFSCFRPPTRLRVSTASFLEYLSYINIFNKESQDFMAKLIASSGEGDETYLPPCFHSSPLQPHQEDSTEEAHMLLFSALDDLLAKTCINPREIDALVVNCSVFCPSPSLSSILVNRYSMREDVKTYSLSGMGCSANAVGIDMANVFLKINPNSYAVILSTEVLSPAWYSGQERNKLMVNCTFRLGSAAILLTNRRAERRRSKYVLNCIVRTHRAFEDCAYCSGIREEDSEGITGFAVGRDLSIFVAKTLRSNVIALGMSILPLSEKLNYVVWHVKKMLLKTPAEAYVPDFRKVIQHYCIPPVGVAYIKEVGRRLRLKPIDVEPALMTFHRFANQSSSSMWYQMAYMEAKGRMKKGDKVWQVAIGSGPKCNSVVWRSLSNSMGVTEKGPWSDCISRYPI